MMQGAVGTQPRVEVGILSCAARTTTGTIFASSSDGQDDSRRDPGIFAEAACNRINDQDPAYDAAEHGVVNIISHVSFPLARSFAQLHAYAAFNRSLPVETILHDPHPLGAIDAR